MNLNEIKRLAIELQRQGKSMEEIQNECKVPLSKEIIESWMQDGMNKSKNAITNKLMKETKQLKSIKLDKENRNSILKELENNLLKRLEINEKDVVAIDELIYGRIRSRQRIS